MTPLCFPQHQLQSQAFLASQIPAQGLGMCWHKQVKSQLSTVKTCSLCFELFGCKERYQDNGKGNHRSYFQDKDLTTIHVAKNINLLICKAKAAGDNLAAGAAVPPVLLTCWEGWRRIKWEKQDLPQIVCTARTASWFVFFFPCSTAWLVAREGLCISPHLRASLARTPRARGLGCKGQFKAQPVIPGLQRVTPAAVCPHVIF